MDFAFVCLAFDRAGATLLKLRGFKDIKFGILASLSFLSHTKCKEPEITVIYYLESMPFKVCYKWILDQILPNLAQTIKAIEKEKN